MIERLLYSCIFVWFDWNNWQSRISRLSLNCLQLATLRQRLSINEAYCAKRSPKKQFLCARSVRTYRRTHYRNRNFKNSQKKTERLRRAAYKWKGLKRNTFPHPVGFNISSNQAQLVFFFVTCAPLLDVLSTYFESADSHGHIHRVTQKTYYQFHYVLPDTIHRPASSPCAMCVVLYLTLYDLRIVESRVASKKFIKLSGKKEKKSIITIIHWRCWRKKSSSLWRVSCVFVCVCSELVCICDSKTIQPPTTSSSSSTLFNISTYSHGSASEQIIEANAQRLETAP